VILLMGAMIIGFWLWVALTADKYYKILKDYEKSGGLIGNGQANTDTGATAGD